jgi:hypothetical protein
VWRRYDSLSPLPHTLVWAAVCGGVPGLVWIVFGWGPQVWIVGVLTILAFYAFERLGPLLGRAERDE